MVNPYLYRATWPTPAGDVLIETVREGDEHELLRFFRERLSPEANHFLALHVYQTDVEALTALHARVVQHVHGEALVYVARQGKAVVGYFFLTRLGLPGMNPSLGIGLADTLQGLGIGGRCIDLLLAAARELGYTVVELTHHPDNQRAAALYRRKGFTYTGEVITWETVAGPRSEPRMRVELLRTPAVEPPAPAGGSTP